MYQPFSNEIAFKAARLYSSGIASPESQEDSFMKKEGAT
jgi:hypothetical protein